MYNAKDWGSCSFSCYETCALRSCYRNLLKTNGIELSLDLTRIDNNAAFMIHTYVHTYMQLNYR